MRNVYGWSLAGVLGVAAIAFAQVRNDEDAATPRRPAAGAADRDADEAAPARNLRDRAAARDVEVDVKAGGQSASADQQLAFCIHGACKNEIAIATFAQDKLQTQAAKQFAAKMIEEHQAGCEKVAQIAGHLVDHSDHAAPGGDRPGADRPGADRPARPETRGEGEDDADAPRAGVRVNEEGVEVRAPGARPGARPGADIEVHAAGGAGGVNWIAIHKELGQRCLESTKKELSKHQGMDFDQAFMGQQLLAHMEMVDKLSVFKNHASPKLRQVIESELQMATNHLNEARQIMEQMKDTETTPRTARRPGSTEDSDERPATPQRRPAPKSNDQPE
jgi:hypothetical protein